MVYFSKQKIYQNSPEHCTVLFACFQVIDPIVAPNNESSPVGLTIPVTYKEVLPIYSLYFTGVAKE